MILLSPCDGPPDQPAAEFRAILERAHAPGTPFLGDLPIEKARAAMARQLIEWGGSGPPMQSVEDRWIPGPYGELRMRVYVPPGRADERSLVLFIHGGGFAVGSIETHDAMARSLAASTLATVAGVDYRPAPESRFPRPPEECYGALCWLRAHAGELGAREAAIAVAGDSAGGALAAALTMMSRDRDGPAIAAQLLMYPALDPALDTGSWRRDGTGRLLTEETMRWYWEQYLSDRDDRKHPYAAPLLADDLSGLPAAIVMTACADPLRDEGDRYAERLGHNGDVTHLAAVGAVHGFLSMTGFSPLARGAIRTCGELLGCALRRPPAPPG